MALHLNAEQKNLRRLWSEYDSFVIPPYQRPYSWSVSECKQLYDDLIDAFNRPSDNDYFIGTMILAVADNQKDECPRIVDGQQRMTTFWLMFKALSVLLPEIPSLIDMLYSREWDGQGGRLRINSLVNDANDMQTMASIYGWDAEAYETRYAEVTDRSSAFKQMDVGDFLETTNNTMEAATLYFYYRLREFKQDDVASLREFAKYLMMSVLIIPIEMHAPAVRDAENKALVIFETINNRGVELSDSDIFKARLYSKAITAEDKDTFVKLWDQMADSCRQLDIDIDTLFTIYMYLKNSQWNDPFCRQGIREFFDGRNGEISHHTYDEIMNQLLEIADILQRYKDMEHGISRVAGWMQMLNVCSSGSISRDAILVAWAMKNDFEENTLEPFLARMVKHMFITGRMFYNMQTTSIIKDIQHNGDSKVLYITDHYSSNFPYSRSSAEMARLALILETGGGLLHYRLMNIVKRKRTSYYETEEGMKGKRKTYFDDSIGNLAFVPTKQARQDVGYDEYFKRLEQADPECAALANNIDNTYHMADVRKRAERKEKVLDEFFGKEYI